MPSRTTIWLSSSWVAGNYGFSTGGFALGAELDYGLLCSESPDADDADSSFRPNGIPGPLGYFDSAGSFVGLTQTLES